MTISNTGIPNLVTSRNTYLAVSLGNYGPDEVAMDSKGNSYVVSYSSAHLTKYNRDLVLQWQKSLSTGPTLSCVVVDPTDTYIYTAGFSTYISTDFYIVKWDTAGTVIWARTFHSSYQPAQQAFSITTDNSGNVIVAGSTSRGSGGAFILKLDTAGNHVWNSVFSNGGTSSWSFTKLTNQGGAVISAVSNLNNSPTSGSNLLLTTVYKDGTTPSYAQLNLPTFRGLVFDSNTAPDTHYDTAGNYQYITGTVYASGANQSYTYVASVVGNYGVNWFKTQYLSGYNRVSSPASWTDTLGHTWVLGRPYTSSASLANLAYVVKYDSSGNLLWSKLITGSAGTATVGNFSGINPFQIRVYNSFVYVYYQEEYNSHLGILKFPDSAVSFTVTDPVTGITVSSTSNVIDGSPTAPNISVFTGVVQNTQGAITAIAETATASINATSAATATVTGSYLSSVSLGQIQTEFGGTNPAALSEYYRSSSVTSQNYVPNDQPNVGNGLIPQTGALSLSNFYGQSNFSITANTPGLNLWIWAKDQGWDGNSSVTVIIEYGVIVYATNSLVPDNSSGNYGIWVDGTWPGGITIINRGTVMGFGGTNSFAGAPGIYIGTISPVTIYNYGVIAGGGGGGGQGAVTYISAYYGYLLISGGGGAGGGQGGTSYLTGGTLGTQYYSGGAGGSAGGAGSDAAGSGIGFGRGGFAGGGGGGYYNGNGGSYYPGGGGGGGRPNLISNPNPTGGQGGYSSNYTGYGAYQISGNGGADTSAGSPYIYTIGGAGGGGFGAAGGAGGGGAGGAGGKAIDLNGQSITLYNSGTLKGAIA